MQLMSRSCFQGVAFPLAVGAINKAAAQQIWKKQYTQPEHLFHFNIATVCQKDSEAGVAMPNHTVVLSEYLRRCCQNKHSVCIADMAAVNL
ncbi:hypothetical protein T4B_10403 [Trichinella pseudospiralis]|uniref:Uncharacterized protein n=1 Tax=Trichinella pseudospiralis TaxID=6337 RepID=A0A0V1IC11_TRIPS|nr:hypothetical protein T4B_10403 [Trichinella pseudospiralis]